MSYCDASQWALVVGGSRTKRTSSNAARGLASRLKNRA